MTETSKEYATALFMLAKENKNERDVSASLATVLDLFQQNPEYVDFLASPSIPKRERIAAIEQALSGNVQDYVVFFVQLLCERGHIRSFEKCVKEFETLYQMSENVSTAQVISVVPLSESEKEQLKSKLEALSGHSVVLECSLDSSLMGGIIVHMDGKVLDGSLKHRLYGVKEVMGK